MSALVISLGVVVAPAIAPSPANADPVCNGGSSISNDTLRLGVNCFGNLNVADPASGLVDGLRFVPTGNDSTSAGAPAEGWGVADETSRLSGFANQSSGSSDNLSLVDFTATATTAVSTVDIGSGLRVTHDYHPSAATPDAYEVTVTVVNTSDAAVDLRYRRNMDWDIEPTPFAEYVTMNPGNSPSLVFTSDNGFAPSDALAGPSSIVATGAFVDLGPNDLGALFDFDFGTLAAGETTVFQTYYGAAADEAGALDAIAAVGAEAYSLGQPSTEDGPTLGTPNTFFFGFADVGGAPVINLAPTANPDDLTVQSAEDSASIDVVANDTDPNDDPLTVTSATQPTYGTVDCGERECTYTRGAEGYAGPDEFDYTVSDGAATSTTTVSVTVEPAVGDPEPEPAVSVDPDGVEFGSVPVGTSVERDVTVTNIGDADLVVSDVAVSGSADYAVTTEDCVATVAPQETCTATVAFSPTGDAGGRQGSLSLTSNATSSPDQVSLNGTADGDTCAGLAATLVGTQGDDTLVGTSGVDVIVGRAGDDVIRGLDGDDVLCGGEGEDTVLGGLGDDTVLGMEGADTIRGQAGLDVIAGNTGADDLDGGRDEDTISGGFGPDSVKGRGGDDVLDGNANSDVLDGGNGTDRIDGGAGFDTVVPSRGADRVRSARVTAAAPLG